MFQVLILLFVLLINNNIDLKLGQLFKEKKKKIKFEPNSVLIFLTVIYIMQKQKKIEESELTLKAFNLTVQIFI